MKKNIYNGAQKVSGLLRLLKYLNRIALDH